MSNRIQQLEVRNQSVIPAEAEVHLTVVPERLDGDTKVHARLVGPRCHFASTIEVAYYLRPFLVPTGRPALCYRAIIPEASLWDPESPHLYLGPVELWQDGVLCERIEIRHGLRSLSASPRGLRINSRLIRLRGKSVTALTDEEALALRHEGYNLLLAPVESTSAMVWEIADRIGFLVLGHLLSPASETLLGQLGRHPSAMGWLLGAGVKAPNQIPHGTLLGVELGGQTSLPQASFHAVRPSEPAGTSGRPLLLVGVPPDQATAVIDDQSVMGMVEE